jgi:predicted nucleic acid-binding protein
MSRRFENELGRPIGANDVSIAAQAIRRAFVLVTANVGDFQRVTGLRWEDRATSSHGFPPDLGRYD